LSFFS